MARVVLDQADGFAEFAGRAWHAEAVGAAHRRFGFDVELHQPHREIAAQIGRHAADGAGLAVEIEHRHIAFGGAVEFQDARHAEARLKLVPHFGPQAIAEAEPQLVRALLRVRRLVDQVAAEFADIDEHGAAVLGDIVPEMRGGEFAPQHQRARRCSSAAPTPQRPPVE